MTDLDSPLLTTHNPSKGFQKIKMASAQASRCQRASSISESEIKPSVDEYISPDILHIFREDRAEAPVGPLTPSLKASNNSARPEEKDSSQFPQFQRLPPEIRYLVWEAAVPEATVVPRTWNNAKFRYNLQRGVPAVLQACAESRALLVAQQPGAGRAASGGGGGGGVAPPKYELVRTPGREDEGVYMDFDRDSIWVYRGCEFDIHFLAHVPSRHGKEKREFADSTRVNRRHQRSRGGGVLGPAQPRHELGPAAVLGRLGRGQGRQVCPQVPRSKTADAAGGFQRARLAGPVDAQGAQEAEAHRGQAHMGPGAGGAAEGRGGGPGVDGAASAYRPSDGEVVS